MTLKETFYNIKEDAKRIGPRRTSKQKIGIVVTCLIDSKFTILFWFRITRYFFLKKNILAKFCFVPSLIIYRVISHWTGIQIPVRVDLMGGAKISHFSDIVIVGESHIGRNLTIS